LSLLMGIKKVGTHAHFKLPSKPHPKGRPFHPAGETPPGAAPCYVIAETDDDRKRNIGSGGVVNDVYNERTDRPERLL
jgi:hypothetical protein